MNSFIVTFRLQKTLWGKHKWQHISNVEMPKGLICSVFERWTVLFSSPRDCNLLRAACDLIYFPAISFMPKNGFQRGSICCYNKNQLPCLLCPSFYERKLGFYYLLLWIKTKSKWMLKRIDGHSQLFKWTFCIKTKSLLI